MGEAAEVLEELPFGDDPYDDTWHRYTGDKSQLWNPEQEINEEPIILSEATRKLPKIPDLKPSQYTKFAFWMPAEDGGLGQDGRGYSPFSFDGRRHLVRVYDSPCKRILLICGRQVEKSTMLGNMALCYMSLVPALRVLYVSPSATQTTTFSNDRIKEPIETSPVLKRFTTQMLSANILEKQFVNRSKITLRYAFLNADRTRGIPADMLEVDEFQDVLSDNIPVIEQCLAHARPQYRIYRYAGTPKSLDNNIEYLRVNSSTQGEWVVPCDSCGSKKGAGRHWNVLGEKNIGRKGLICEKCGVLLNQMHPDAHWASMVAWDPVKVPFESYRINQLMVPWKPWDEVLIQYEKYPRDKFYNEVLGISYDSGLRPLTRGQVLACCRQDLTMSNIESYRALGYNQPIFAGIDWGTGENSYTVLTLATYVDMKFRVFFWHRFVGEEIDPDIQLARIIELIEYFNVKIIGSDYGGGYDRNHHLVRKFGPKRVYSFQYMARTHKRIWWDTNMIPPRFKVARTEVMSDIFNAIKRNQCEFPRQEEFIDPFAMDMTNIYSEYNETLRSIQYKHSQDKPDDSFHSLVYCWLVSMMMIPRRDIIAPTLEIDGKSVGEYSGPIDQG